MTARPRRRRLKALDRLQAERAGDNTLAGGTRHRCHHGQRQHRSLPVRASRSTTSLWSDRRPSHVARLSQLPRPERAFDRAALTMSAIHFDLPALSDFRFPLYGAKTKEEKASLM